MSCRQGRTTPTSPPKPAAPTVSGLRSDDPIQALPTPTDAHRELLAPAAVGTTGCAGGQGTRPRRWPCRWAGRLRMTRRRALVMLALSLVVLLGCPLATAALGPDSSSPVAAAQPLP